MTTLYINSEINILIFDNIFNMSNMNKNTENDFYKGVLKNYQHDQESLSYSYNGYSIFMKSAKHRV